MRRLSGAKLISLGAMCTALGVLCLYAAAVLPTGRVALYFLASLFVYVPAAESAYLGAVGVYLATGVLSLLILPSRAAAVPYIVLLGHFGILDVPAVLGRAYPPRHKPEKVGGLSEGER